MLRKSKRETYIEANEAALLGTQYARTDDEAFPDADSTTDPDANSIVLKTVP